MKLKLISSAMLLCITSTVAYAHGDDEAAAIGKPGNDKKVTRTVSVGMSDTMRFTPSQLTVRSGETIRFVVKNTGKLRHEMVLDTEAGLKEHAALMRRVPEMEHADANAVTVEPGRSAQIIWQFTKAGVVDFACLEPGHFEAGMAGKIAVRDGRRSDNEMAAR